MWAELHTLPASRWVGALRPSCGQPTAFSVFCLQGRPSSLATTPIRPSCHLSGCQLIIMILMIFQLDSALNPDQEHSRFPTRPHHQGAPPPGKAGPVRPAGQPGEAPPSTSTRHTGRGLDPMRPGLPHPHLSGDRPMRLHHPPQEGRTSQRIITLLPLYTCFRGA